jgi:hypothetical protein|tara:strand:+ start:656 stop:880 length:225 start_codon:yes stop_codon:yes gene_type:complete
MKRFSESFGKIDNFEVGNLVFWKNFGEKEFGVVSKLFFLQKGGRKVAHARVFRLRGKEYIDLPTIILKIEQKNN